MSSFDKGKAFEQKVAAMVRRKADGGAKRDSRSGANWHRRSDIFTNLPLHIEVKDHETLKPKEWFREASSAASFNQTPVVVFHSDEEVMAMLRFDDLLNLFVEIADLKAEVEDLSKPVGLGFQGSMNPDPKAHGNYQTGNWPQGKVADAVVEHFNIPKTAAEVKEQVQQLPPRRTSVCPEGHFCDEYGKCIFKGCKYSRGYKAKKKPKE